VTTTDRKEWLSVKHSPTGTTVTASLQEGNLSVRWTVKGYVSLLAKGVAEAKSGAEAALAELKEAVESVREAA